MATDYKKINVKSRINLRSIRDQRGDKTHFVYELVQNADDSKSKQIELHLCEKELLVWNDGCKFREEDVLRISSIGFSDKDLTQIGNFGTGFKAVYNYTDRPEVYSGDERFCLPDPTSTSKTLEDLASSSLVEGIDKVPPRIAELVEEGKTVFRLPFKEDLRQEDLMLLKDQLRKLLKKRSLLFLPHLETIQWHNIHDGQTGTYRRYLHGKIQSADHVELKASMNGKDPESERFLVFSKKFQPRGGVIDELLQIEYDEERRKRIQETGEKLQPIEVAFKLQDDRITSINNCVLFAYLPTEKETRLRFLIQARYQTNPARNDIEKTDQNPWNRWLIEATANFLPEILEQLKDGGLLETTFFNVLPLEGEVENDFKPIAKALKGAMKERTLIPTEKEGHYAKAENVFYPNSTPLRKLVKSSGMHSDISLLHPHIRKDTKESGRCFDVMAEAGVKEIDETDLLRWLEEKSCEWFKNKTNKWLCSLYIYFNKKWSKSELERIKELPLVRLENEEHVRVSDQLVYFPPETDEDLEDIKPLLNDLRILKSTLLRKEGYNDIKAFLENIGVEDLHPENLINESICPLYSQPNKPPIMKNRRHVHYIFKSWQKTEGFERSRLERSISKVPILRAYRGIQREVSDFVVPCNAYLTQAYTDDNDLETYFSVSDGDLWFVDDKYLTNKSDTKVWLQFLKAIGAMNTPPIPDVGVSGSSEECKKRSIIYENSTRPFKDGEFKDMYRRPYQYFDGHIIDASFDGLSEVLAQIGNHNKIGLPKALWGLLVKLVSSLPSEEWQRYGFFRDLFQGTYYWYYNGEKQKFFDAAFYCQLKEMPWLPDKQGNFHVPSKCFAPTNDNREVLGDSVPYLHPDFNVSTQPARWLAKKLGVHLQADTDGVLGYLQILSQTETSIEKVKPIYKFLESEDADLWRFEEEPLILTPEPESRWWRTDEVFWVDESPVFGDHCGYLADYYGDPLKGFFKGLGVRERAAPSDYIRVIRDIASAEVPEDSEVRERVQILYSSLWQSLEEDDSSLENKEWEKEWEQIREGRCWLGKIGDEWRFFFLEELVWNDHNYCAEIVEGEVPFWAFGDDLLEFAKHLGIEGCYQASNIEFDYYDDQGEYTIESEKVQKLSPYIHDFLNSTPWRGICAEEKTAEILDRLAVRRAQKLKVRYELKGTSVPDPNPRQSFLDTTNQETTLWLGLEESEGAYPDLIGDALQDYFGINELREFIKDLLLTTDSHRTTLLNWERRGFQPDLCLSPPELDSKEDEEKSSEPVDNEFPDETGNAEDSGTSDCETETPTGQGDPKTGNEGSDPTGDESDTPTHRPRPGRGGARWPGGSGSNTPNRSTGTGYGGGGRPEGKKHRTLKEYLADNPSLFGEGLELIDTEYRFRSGDEADILFEDSSGNPVTVEVKPPISSGSDQEVWQAVKYKHLAAVKYDLPCKEVRSILAAPEIPDDVKAECEKLGIEPIEISNQMEDTDE